MKSQLTFCSACMVATTVLAGCNTPIENTPMAITPPHSSNTSSLTVRTPTVSSHSTKSTSVKSGTVKLHLDQWIDIHMMDKLVGWGVVYALQGGTSSIVRTTNGGESWQNASPSMFDNHNPNGVNFIDGRQAWFAIQPVSKSGNTYQQVLNLFRTTDGGKSWQSISIPLHSQTPVYKTHISVIDGTIYLDLILQHGMSGMSGNLLVSHDGGKSWSQVSSPNHPPFGGQMQFVNASTGWLSTAGCTTCNRKLYETTDGGKTWAHTSIPIPSQYDGDEVSLSLPQFSSTHPAQGRLVARFETKSSVIEHRAMYATDNGGTSWTFAGDLPGHGGLLSFPSTHVGVVIPMTLNKTFPDLYETTANGKAWTRVRLPKTPFSSLLKTYDPAQLDFVSKDIGFVVWAPRRGGTATDQLWKTTDGGKDWVKIWS